MDYIDSSKIDSKQATPKDTLPLFKASDISLNVAPVPVSYTHLPLLLYLNKNIMFFY